MVDCSPSAHPLMGYRYGYLGSRLLDSWGCLVICVRYPVRRGNPRYWSIHPSIESLASSQPHSPSRICRPTAIAPRKPSVFQGGGLARFPAGTRTKRGTRRSLFALLRACVCACGNSLSASRTTTRPSLCSCALARCTCRLAPRAPSASSRRACSVCLWSSPLP